MSFEQFWPYYVGEHRSKWTRRLHFAGTALGLALLCRLMLAGKMDAEVERISRPAA